MTLLQRLILEAGTMVIVVLGAYALTPVLLMIIAAGQSTEKSHDDDKDEPVQD